MIHDDDDGDDDDDDKNTLKHEGHKRDNTQGTSEQKDRTHTLSTPSCVFVPSPPFHRSILAPKPKRRAVCSAPQKSDGSEPLAALFASRDASAKKD